LLDGTTPTTVSTSLLSKMATTWSELTNCVASESRRARVVAIVLDDDLHLVAVDAACAFSHEAQLNGREVWAIDEAPAVQLQMSPSTIGWLVLAPAVVAPPDDHQEALNKRRRERVRIRSTSRLTERCHQFLRSPEPPIGQPVRDLRLGPSIREYRCRCTREGRVSGDRRTEAGPGRSDDLAWRTPNGWRPANEPTEWPSASRVIRRPA